VVFSETDILKDMLGDYIKKAIKISGILLNSGYFFAKKDILFKNKVLAIKY